MMFRSDIFYNNFIEYKCIKEDQLLNQLKANKKVVSSKTTKILTLIKLSKSNNSKKFLKCMIAIILEISQAEH